MYPWPLAMGQILPLHKVPQGYKVPRGRYDPNFLFWCGFFIRYYGYYYMAIILYSITINMIILCFPVIVICGMQYHYS